MQTVTFFVKHSVSEKRGKKYKIFRKKNNQNILFNRSKNYYYDDLVSHSVTFILFCPIFHPSLARTRLPTTFPLYPYPHIHIIEHEARGKLSTRNRKRTENDNNNNKNYALEKYFVIKRWKMMIQNRINTITARWKTNMAVCEFIINI